MPTSRRFLPTGAMLLAGSLGASSGPCAHAQVEPPAPQTVVVTGERNPEGKDSLRSTRTRIGKGDQALRDVPQSVTVVTERLIDDRNLDTMKEALKATAGISFLAAEGGEEDVRLRGFSLQATGDVFVDGIRDPAFYERDTFNLDRLEVLRGSASMLFGRGSTGGAVNQVSKLARAWDENQFDLTLGSHRYRRLVVDMNKGLGDSAGLRLTAMSTQADNNGSGSSLDKRGVALNGRFGIGGRDEYSLSAYWLENRNGMNYGLPWIRPGTSSNVLDNTTLPLDPSRYYGLASDHNHGNAGHGTATHVHHFGGGNELRTTLRSGHYTRDQRASAIRLASAALQGGTAATLDSLGSGTVLTRGTNLKMQDLDTLNLQSDFSAKREAWGMKHEILAGVDMAREVKTVYAARTAAQGGVDLTKPNTQVGTPADGAEVTEAARVWRVASQYTAHTLGAYAQDLVQVAPYWKLLGGLRYDHLVGDYDSFGNPPNTSDNGIKSSYRMTVAQWSKRAGLLYQPSERHSFHLSAASSFNTSGDAYSLGASNVDTPPEQSINLELGARIDSADKRLTTRLALFRATKKNERNTDPLLPVVTLSGRRHVAGLEVDFAGKPLAEWEFFASFTWMPEAQVDKAAPCPSNGACTQGAPGERQGDRPALTPRYSGSMWSTWQFNHQWRAGGGLNLRGRQTPTRAEFEVPAFVTLDAMIEFKASEALTLKFNLSNLANTLYADQLYPAHYVPGAGRVAQLTGSLAF